MRRISVLVIAAVLLLTGCAAQKDGTPSAAPAVTASQEDSTSSAAPAVTSSQEDSTLSIAPVITAEIQADKAVVSYLGPEGTYTQEACGVFFDSKGTYAPYETVRDAVQALTEGYSNFAVIPQENTIGGAVIDYVDILIAQTDVSVVGEVELPINQNLLTLPGAKAETIRTVYSHKQGIAQGKAWLEANLPHAKVVEVSSTAEGAKMVAESGDPSCAAIASAACADVYGLEVYAAAIQNNDSNKTRFYVLSMQPPATAEASRTAMIASGCAAELPALLSAMQERGITLVALHDRPLKTELGEYAYVIECTGCTYAQYQALADTSGLRMRYLGSFDVR